MIDAPQLAWFVAGFVLGGVLGYSWLLSYVMECEWHDEYDE